MDAVIYTSSAYSLLSDIAATHKDPARAVSFSTILETLNPSDGDSVFLHAQRLAQAGRWTDALARLDRLRKVNPDNGDIVNTYGVALYHNGNLTAARTEFLEALKLVPNSTDYESNLKVCEDAINEKGAPISLQPLDAKDD
ncbi:hypothetical protein CTAYLR_000730 [Chrysophaeum taylorii]|uniref:Tetratricopeptide repeat protein n=1 Tax=Chrysophaeum taylorii TaxID=2483200 RepID=A0AAD7U8V6_9STRA|nr:hypothetical protein CTAYLR_000730 [Chrysophaeum taylorii]